MPRRSEFGITALANHTGFDAIGIPVWMASRPAAASLSISMGKGLTSDDAKASAFMEALEFSIAEKPRVESFLFDLGRPAASEGHVVGYSHLLPVDSDARTDGTTQWLKGKIGRSEVAAWAPLDALDLAPKAQCLSKICKTTNGLASGNNFDEAYFHALCELIERDGETLWSLLNPDLQQKSEISVASIDETNINELCALIAKAGLTVRLLDMTSDIGVPVVGCVIYGSDPGESWAAGSGCHPNQTRAMIRAITEAAQSRVTGILGTRDDISGAWVNANRLPVKEQSIRSIGLPLQASVGHYHSLPVGTPLAAQIKHLETRLIEAGDLEVYSFELARDPHFSVVKLLSPDLEDREPNLYWQPRKRAMQRMVG